jgi:adenylate cyclase, class 2
MMHEVEVKFRVRNPAAVVAALKARGIELGPPVEQDDKAYAPEAWSYGDDRRGVPFARLRTVDGRHLFTVKQPAENVLSCQEHETAIADRAQMHRAIVRWASCPPSGSARSGGPLRSAS